MKVQRQFERHGPLWVPRYHVERPWERYLRRFQAAITFPDTVSTNTATLSTTLNITHTVSSATNRVLYVAVHGRDVTAGDRTVSGITWNGTEALTLVGATDSGGGAINRSELWRRINPTAGTFTVAITMGGTCTELGGAALTVAGVHQTTPEDVAVVTASGSDATPTANITTVTDNAVALDALGTGFPSPTVGAGQTQRWNFEITVGAGYAAGSTEPKVTAGLVTMSWSMAADDWALVVTALRPAVAADRLGANFYHVGRGPTQMGGRIG